MKTNALWRQLNRGQLDPKTTECRSVVNSQRDALIKHQAVQQICASHQQFRALFVNSTHNSPLVASEQPHTSAAPRRAMMEMFDMTWLRSTNQWRSKPGRPPLRPVGRREDHDADVRIITLPEPSATPTPPPAPATTFETLATTFRLRAPDADAGCGQGKRRRAIPPIRRCSIRWGAGGSSRW